MRAVQLPAMLTVRIPPDLLPAIVAAAEQRGASRSDWIRTALADAVAQGRAARAPAPRDRAAA